MKEQIIVDIGSGRTKVYGVKADGSVIRILSTRIRLKERYNPTGEGVLEEDKETLFRVINEVVAQAEGRPINVYATSIFRVMPDDMLERFKEELLERTGVSLNVLSQEQENKLTTLPVKNLEIDGRYCAACIGSGSTEVAVFQDGEERKSFTTEHAKADLIKKFPELRESICKTSPEDLRNYVRKTFDFAEVGQCDKLIIIGGSGLEHAKDCGFKMEDNNVFIHKDIPARSSFESFTGETNKLLGSNGKIANDDLELIRAHCIIASCLMEAVSAKECFMTNLNLINGIVQDIKNKEVYVNKETLKTQAINSSRSR